MKKDKLLILDLDGTLYDTREVNFNAYKEALSYIDVNLDREFYYNQCNGKYYKDYLPIIVPTITPEQMEKIHSIKKECYSSYLYTAKENSVLFDIINALSQTYYVALVTTASRKNVNAILSAFHRTDVFDLIIAQEDVNDKKPNPEGFLLAISYFNISLQNAVVFEDSITGIQAACNAGINYFVTEGFH